MKVLLETPACLVVEGTTMLAEVSGGCLKMSLMVLCLPLLTFVLYALTMALAGDPTLAIIALLSGAAVACLAFALRQRGPGPARRKAATPGARLTTFDAVAGTVAISGIGTYPLQDVSIAMLDQSEEGGYNVQLRFYNREAVLLSPVYIDEARVAHVLERIQQFLARRSPRPSPPPAAPVFAPPPSVQEAQTKEEFERALEAMRQEIKGQQREPGGRQRRE
jgi:hypothetical protein